MHSMFFRYGVMPRYNRCWFSLGLPTWLSYLIIIGLSVLAIVLIVLLILNLRKGKNRFIEDSEAIEIIKKRYANGEIDKETFEQLKKDLR
jgi:putative membrane protein